MYPWAGDVLLAHGEEEAVDDEDVLDETNYNAGRHCSDPISVETVDGDVDSICENLADDAQKYPRLMKADVDTVYTPLNPPFR